MSAEHMTRAEVRSYLRGMVEDYAIDPHDAVEVWGEVPADGVDVETLADWLEGQGYPNLAADLLAGVAA